MTEAFPRCRVASLQLRGRRKAESSNRPRQSALAVQDLRVAKNGYLRLSVSFLPEYRGRQADQCEIEVNGPIVRAAEAKCFSSNPCKRLGCWRAWFWSRGEVKFGKFSGHLIST
jgi:hypothetical protein